VGNEGIDRGKTIPDPNNKKGPMDMKTNDHNAGPIAVPQGWHGRRAAICLVFLLAVSPLAGAATIQVQVAGGALSFAPDSVTIHTGDTVQWNWFGPGHSVTSGTDGKADGLFNAGIHSDGFTFSFTFQNPGTYNYFCGPHYSMGMVGVVQVTAAANPTTLANISTRLPVQTDDNALIGGFIITGSQPKKVIIRAIGPSLSLPGKLSDPVLQLFSGSTLLESNDNWIDSPNKQAITDSTVAPGNNLESAIVRTLPANGASYTAVVRGLNNTTGIGVVEAYDLDLSADSKLANISTRGLVQTDPNVMIAGTIVVGQNSQKVIVRAIGPSLSISGKLDDPSLELRDSNGALLQANDNWKDSPNKQAIIDSTVPPTHDLESAVVATLPANGASYTAIVRGVGGTDGIAVVEVYALP
jgi:plastocyanin